jgi:hypothetical protein
MKGATSLLNSIASLKRSKDLMKATMADIPSDNSVVKKACKVALGRIEKAYMDILTAPGLGEDYRTVLRREWASDQWTNEAILEKLVQLTPETRETVETLIDGIINGETINIVDSDSKNTD